MTSAEMLKRFEEGPPGFWQWPRWTWRWCWYYLRLTWWWDQRKYKRCAHEWVPMEKPFRTGWEKCTRCGWGKLDPDRWPKEEE